MATLIHSLKANIYNKQSIVLILGQVESDASIKFGVPPESNIKSNFDLVSATRDLFPRDYLIYKPHPDVESGMRLKGDNDFLIENLCDEIITNVDIADLFPVVDKVSVLTSLGGFEALIRNIPVTTWGLPFYAGWGLTDDRLEGHRWIKDRRKRNLDLEELVYLTLIEYPFYFSISQKETVEVETIVSEFSLEKGVNKKLNYYQYLFRYWGLIKEYFIR